MKAFLSFSGVCVIASLCASTFGPVDVITSCFFQKDLWLLNVMSGSGTVTCALMAIPFAGLFERLGFYSLAWILAVSTIVSGFFRVAAPLIGSSMYFWLLFVSQCIVELVNGLMFVLVPVACKQLLAKSRVSVGLSTLCVLSLVASGVGACMSGVILKCNEREGDPCYRCDLSHFEKPLLYLFLTQGIGLILLGLAACFAFGLPVTSATVKAKQETLCKSVIKPLGCNKDFLVLQVQFLWTSASFIGVAAVLQQLIERSEIGAVVSLVSICAGAFASVGCGLILQRYAWHRGLLQLCTIGSVTSLCVLLLGIAFNQLHAIAFGASFLRFFLVPNLPIVLELANNVTSINSETLPGAVLFCLGNVAAFVFIISISFAPPLYVLGCLTCFALVSTLAVLFSSFSPVSRPETWMEEQNNQFSEEGSSSLE